MTYKVIDNFLDEEYFNRLVDLICNGQTFFAWYYCRYYGQHKDEENDPLRWFYTHIIYADDVPMSPHGAVLQELRKAIEDEEEEGIKAMIRMRANHFPNTPNNVHQHEMHVDAPFSHTAALLSLNTCDGYTGIENEDGTTIKVDSIANRIVFFNAGKKHCSSTTTNAKARFNIIINYL
jgi:hypothetical protein